jgi:hypothetical protein
MQQFHFFTGWGVNTAGAFPLSTIVSGIPILPDGRLPLSCPAS